MHIIFINLVLVVKEIALFLIINIKEHGKGLIFFPRNNLSFLQIVQSRLDVFNSDCTCIFASFGLLLAVGKVATVHEETVNVLGRLLLLHF